MDKIDLFLLKISSKNRKWRMLRDKEKIYAKLLTVPYCESECAILKEEINILRKELNI